MTTQTESHTRLNGRWLAIARAAWKITAVLALGFLVASLPGYLFAATQGHFAGRVVEIPAGLLSALDVMGVLTSFIAALVCLALAGLIFWRRSDDPIALYVSFYLLVFGIVMAGPLDRLDVVLPGSALLATRKLQPILATTPTVLLFVVFPTGRFVPRWSRWLILPSLLLAAVNVWLPPIDTPPMLVWVGGIMWLTVCLLAVYAQVYRYRHVSGPTERQQTKWATFGFALWVVWITFSSVPYYMVVLELPPDAPLPWWVPLASAGWWLSLLVIPLFLTIAVMRYRLFDIDVIINRTLVYGALTASVIGIYVLVVGVLGTTIQGRGNLLVSILATGLVAVLVQPLRDSLQRGINRMMYGERDDPVTVLSRLGLRLEATLAPDAVLPSLVETVAQTLKLPYVAIETTNQRLDHQSSPDPVSYGGPAPKIAHGNPIEDVIRFPLIYQSETIGQLLVAPRAPGEALSPMDRHLLENIAHQAGMAVHAVNLTVDLQRSRQRLVTTREEERRRLRRDLHDGLGPNLASQGLKLAAIKQLAVKDPASAISLLEQVMTQNQSTVEEVRRLVYGLRPPALDELGLVAAIRDHVAGMDGKSTLQIEITEPAGGLPPLSAAVEVAAYRIVLEALTNVIRHAQAKNCSIRFSMSQIGSNGDLQVEVIDDGVGLPRDLRAGVGLRSMRERAEEVGGQLTVESQINVTRILAILPISEMVGRTHRAPQTQTENV